MFHASRSNECGNDLDVYDVRRQEEERTEAERKEFDKFVERDPSTWRNSEEIERFHDMEDKAFGHVYPTDVDEHETWSPPFYVPPVLTCPIWLKPLKGYNGGTDALRTTG